MDRLTALRVSSAWWNRAARSGWEILEMSCAMVSRYPPSWKSLDGARLHCTTCRAEPDRAGRSAEPGQSQGWPLNDGTPPSAMTRPSAGTLHHPQLLSGSPAGRAANDHWPVTPARRSTSCCWTGTVNLEGSEYPPLRITNGPRSQTRVARRLGTLPLGWCAPARHLARHACRCSRCRIWHCTTALTLHLFRQEPVGFLGPDGPESVPVSGNLSANISNLLLAATLDGAGISLQPACRFTPIWQAARSPAHPVAAQAPRRLCRCMAPANRCPLLRSLPRPFSWSGWRTIPVEASFLSDPP